MYNYNHEHHHRSFGGQNYFYPQHESENFESEYGNEYELEPGLNMEESFETGQAFEDESRAMQDEIIVRDHRSRGAVHVPTRPGYSYRPSHAHSYVHTAGHYNNPRYNYFKGAWHRPNSNYNYRPGYNYNQQHGYYYHHPHWHRHWPGFQGNTQQYNGDQAQSLFDSGSPAATAAPGTTGSDPILDSIRNLAQQIAATNANVASLQQSISAGNTGAPPATPPDMMQPPLADATATPPGPKEMEMENYEYGNSAFQEYEEENEEMMETELAAELLATNNDHELDHFLGGLVPDSLKGLLKTVIKKALPIAGAAAGAYFGGPLGSQIGQKIGSAASNMFEMELEGLSNEDQEFEVARAVVRLAKDAGEELNAMPPSGNPEEDARQALIQSAIHNAPGLLVKKHHHHHHTGYGSEGHWHRHGNKIIIENAI